MTGAGRPWRDEIADALSIKNTGTAGVVANTTACSVTFKSNAGLTDYLYTNVQLNHDRDLATAISPHIHWLQSYAAIPNFLLQYRWQRLGLEIVSAWTDLKCNTAAFDYATVFPGGTGTLHQICEGTNISVPTGTTISDIVQFRIIRDTADDNTGELFGGADPESHDVEVLAFDVHIQINSLGSATEYSKL
jgi:hypothetical protein